MGIAEFIRARRDELVGEWTSFARTRMPAASGMSEEELANSCAKLLDAIAEDMSGEQSAGAQEEKAKGERARGRIDNLAADHALERFESGFDLLQMAAEFRALRATVIKRWQASLGERARATPVDELTRFNEAIDQLLARSIERFDKRLAEVRNLFTGMLGHDLRQPLTTTLVAASGLARDPQLPPRQQETARRIVSGAERMARMVADILDLTRARLGHGLPMQLAPADLGAIARRAKADLETAHPNREVRLTTDGDLTGQFDADRLAQLLSNLIGNALQHGAEDSPVELRVSAKKEWIELSVANAGPAIPSTVMSRMFEPMVQGDPGRKKEADSGLGLGLYIARQIAIAHRGSIDVRSSRQDGTVFTVRLPREPSRNPNG